MANLAPVPSENNACAHCGSPLVADQRYCLSCGQPASPVRLAFLGVLRARNVTAHFRRPRGRDIDAACGQLRRRTAGA